MELELEALQLLSPVEEALEIPGPGNNCGWTCKGSSCEVTCFISCLVTNN
ncbi:hypothetical protein OG339_41630 [Streptosporangium sp. NBC_01495]|nr:hypothetical protein [Streptosporangium sp. NBC_01495]